MKLTQWIALVCCAVPFSAYALLCPKNSQFVDIGDSVLSVVKVCGEPTSIEKIDNSIILSAIWTYINETDTATTTTKLTMDNGQISKMIQSVNCKSTDSDCFSTVDQPIQIFSAGCQQQIYVGNNIPWVEKFCGPPDHKLTLKAIYDVTEEYYYANTNMPSTLIFVNGKLDDTN